MLRLGRVARKLDHYLEYGAAVLVLLIFMFVLIAHWFACVWYNIGESEAKKGEKLGWLYKLAKDVGEPFTQTNTTGTAEWVGHVDPGEAYATALYYTLSCMTSVGFGNISSNTEMEKIFTICMMILGCKYRQYLPIIFLVSPSQGK